MAVRQKTTSGHTTKKAQCCHWAFEHCIRQGSNLKPSVPKFVKASFRVSDAGENPGFSGVFAFTSLRSSVPKAEKTRISGGISGGTLNASFHPEQPRHARRGHLVLVPPQPTKKVRRPFPDSLVPRSLLSRCSFLVPDSLAADGFFKAWLTSMLREEWRLKLVPRKIP